jgi:hypothetical protein
VAVGHFIKVLKGSDFKVKDQQQGVGDDKIWQTQPGAGTGRICVDTASFAVDHLWDY